MINILLFVHIVISLLLVIIILMQKSSDDGLSSMSGSGNLGMVAGKTVAGFLSKTTVVLASLFFVSSLVLANFSNRINDKIIEKIENTKEDKQEAPDLAPKIE